MGQLCPPWVYTRPRCTLQGGDAFSGDIHMTQPPLQPSTLLLPASTQSPSLPARQPPTRPIVAQTPLSCHSPALMQVGCRVQPTAPYAWACCLLVMGSLPLTPVDVWMAMEPSIPCLCRVVPHLLVSGWVGSYTLFSTPHPSSLHVYLAFLKLAFRLLHIATKILNM